MTEGRLDEEAFSAFAPLLRACQDYAELSGSRFLRGAFNDVAGEAKEEEQRGNGKSELIAAKLRAAPAVEEFGARLRAGESALLECIDRAYRMVMAESIRSGIVATCRELQMWPPRPKPSGVKDDDCKYEDTSEPLPAIAQRVYNDEMRRLGENALQPLLRRAATASFIIDFAGEAGAVVPSLSESHHEMLQEFMKRVEEWLQSQSPTEQAHSGNNTPRASSRARRALLAGLGLGIAADAVRLQVESRWTKNWETNAGTLMNVAAVGLAVLAGITALRSAARGK
mmetsp:Transcript_57660/g.124674  ORF Transcript_57660/g.124674 Transcript_57660/m.124674 type:complete len:284 (+) Transcript_57660:35-886(+)